MERLEGRVAGSRRGPRDECGGVLVFVALGLTACVAMLALAIDLGMRFAGHNEAQRAADAAALAGASAFLEFGDPLDAVDTARARALDYARRNSIRNQPIDSAEVAIEVIPAESKVRVTIRRGGLPTWFARIFGVTEMAVSARAAAEATTAGAARCLKPFAIPDIWDERETDTNGNRVWDPGEQWKYNPQRDRYKRFEGDDADPDATGYGSPFRNDRPSPPAGFKYTKDYGRQILIKATDPNDPSLDGGPFPGIFLPWELPASDLTQECQIQPGGNETGAKTYMANICNCNSSRIVLGQEYNIKTGNMVGPTAKALKELIDEDPDARWDEALQKVVGSRWGENWLESPRVIRVAMWDPGEITKPGKTSIKFNNFGLFFIEDQGSQKNPVKGRFLFYVAGEQGPVRGSLIKTLRLVE